MQIPGFENTIQTPLKYRRLDKNKSVQETHDRNCLNFDVYIKTWIMYENGDPCLERIFQSANSWIGSGDCQSGKQFIKFSRLRKTQESFWLRIPAFPPFYRNVFVSSSPWKKMVRKILSGVTIFQHGSKRLCRKGNKKLSNKGARHWVLRTWNDERSIELDIRCIQLCTGHFRRSEQFASFRPFVDQQILDSMLDE